MGAAVKPRRAKLKWGKLMTALSTRLNLAPYSSTLSVMISTFGYLGDLIHRLSEVETLTFYFLWLLGRF